MLATATRAHALRAPSTVQTNGKYLSKHEAGVWLGTVDSPMSPRRVLELAKEGKLDHARMRDPNTGQTVVRISAESVERFLESRKNPIPIPDPVELSHAPQPSSQTSRALAATLVDLLRDSRAAHPARLWLTLPESAAYSGLPAAILLSFIDSGKLNALNVGRRRGGKWRIRRSDLEGFDGR